MCPGDATGVTEGPHGPEQPHLGSPGALFKLISGPWFFLGLCRRGAALQLSLALGTLSLILTCCLPGTVLAMPHHSGPADGLPGSPWDLPRCGDALCSQLALAATSGFGHPPICLPGDGGEGRNGAGLFTFVLQVVLKRARSPWGSGSAVYSLSWVPGLEPVKSSAAPCCGGVQTRGASPGAGVPHAVAPMSYCSPDPLQGSAWPWQGRRASRRAVGCHTEQYEVGKERGALVMKRWQ